VKLLKLDFPTFDGHILNMNQFREQCCISVHSCTILSDAEKPVHLEQVVKNGSAKGAINGLSCTNNNYIKAIACLASW